MNFSVVSLLALIALLMAVASFVVEGFPLVTVAVILLSIALLTGAVTDRT